MILFTIFFLFYRYREWFARDVAKQEFILQTFMDINDCVSALGLSSRNVATLMVDFSSIYETNHDTVYLRLAHPVHTFLINDWFSPSSPSKKNVFLPNRLGRLVVGYDLGTAPPVGNALLVPYTCTKRLTFSMSTSSDSYTSAIVIWCLAAMVNRPWGGNETNQRRQTLSPLICIVHIFQASFFHSGETEVHKQCRGITC